MLEDNEFHKVRMENLFGKGWDAKPAPAVTLETAGVEAEIVSPDQLDIRGPVSLNDNMPDDPVGQAIAEIQFQRHLEKRETMVDPLLDDDELLDDEEEESEQDDEELSDVAKTRQALSADFLKRSDARLEQVNQTLRKVFHGEELEQAIALAAKLRGDVREEFIESA
jgi:hypothetical protein